MRIGFFSPQPTPTADHFVVTGVSTITAGNAAAYTVTAKTPAGSTDTAYTGTMAFASSDPSTTAKLHSSSSMTNGTGAFSATLVTAGAQSINAQDGSASNPNGSLRVLVVASTTTHITLTGAVSNATAGVGFPVTVTALDTYNNVATGYTGTIALTSTDGAAVLGANATLTSGIGTFSVTLKTSGTQTVTATDTATSSFTAHTSGIVVAAANPTHFVLTGQSAATAGVGFNLTVTAEDQFNNVAAGYSGNVALTSSDTNAIVPVTGKNVMAAGVGTFSATLTTSGTQTLTATDSLLSTLTKATGGITVAAAAASQYVVTTPAAETHSVGFKLTVTAEDQFNNTATGYAGTLIFSGSDTAGTYHANATLTSGVGTFSATLVTTGNQTVTVEDSASSVTGTSGTIVVS
jgi:hypothetical protein